MKKLTRLGSCFVTCTGGRFSFLCLRNRAIFAFWILLEIARAELARAVSLCVYPWVHSTGFPVPGTIVQENGRPSAATTTGTNSLVLR